MQADSAAKRPGPYPPGSIGAWMWAGLAAFVEKHRPPPPPPRPWTDDLDEDDFAIIEEANRG